MCYSCGVCSLATDCVPTILYHLKVACNTHWLVYYRSLCAVVVLMYS